MGIGLVGFGCLVLLVTFFFLPYWTPTSVPTEGLAPRVQEYTGWELASWDLVGHGQPNPHPLATALWVIPFSAVGGMALLFLFLRRASRLVAVGIVLLGLGVAIPQTLPLITQNASGDAVLSGVGFGYWVVWAAAVTLVLAGIILASARSVHPDRTAAS
jgi:hypothetical protein